MSSDTTSNSSYTPSYQSDLSTHDTATTLSLTSLESSEEDSVSTNSSIDIDLDGLLSTQHTTGSSNELYERFSSNTSILSAPTADLSYTDSTLRTVSTLSLLHSPKGSFHLKKNTACSHHPQATSLTSKQSTPSDSEARSALPPLNNYVYYNTYTN
jgi:hypothetical protein